MGRGPGRVGLIGIAIAGALALGGCGDAGPDTFTVTVPGSAMAPAVPAGARVLVTRVPEGYAPTRGQIVVFTDPGGWLSADPAAPPGKVIKRIIAITGDRIVCCTAAGRLEINGRPVTEPYLNSLRGRCAAELFPPAGQRRCHWTIGPVPAGTVFVLGDNRVNSADSRFHMCPPHRRHCTQSPWVPVSDIVGTVQAP